MGLIKQILREIKQNRLQKQIREERIALNKNRQEYNSLRNDYYNGNIGSIKYAFLLFKNKIQREMLSNTLKRATDNLAMERSDAAFKKDFSLKDTFDLDNLNHAERWQRSKEGALHNTGKKSHLPGASIKSKINGKEIVRYDHYNKKTHSAELDLDKPVTWWQGTDKGLVQKKVDSVSIKLDKNGKIDLSLPENKQLLSTPGLLPEIIKKYPEAYATLPPDRTYGKDVIKALCEGAQDKISSGNIPPNEDGSDRTVTEYQLQMIEIVDKKQQEIAKQQAKQQQAHQQQTQIQQKFDNLENEF